MADSTTLTPEQHRVKTTVEQERVVVRLQDELDRMIKLFSWAREAMENDLMGGLGYKKLTVTDKDLKKLKELATMCDSIVGAKIRFDKAAKAMADTMTPAEEKAAVIAFIKAAEPIDRSDIIKSVKDWQDRKNAGSDSTS